MLHNVFEEFIDSMDRKYSDTELADIGNVDKSTISKFRNKKNSREINFYSYLKIIKTLDFNRELEIMEKACLYFTKPENIRCVLEYCSLHRLLPLLDNLLILHSENTNPVLREAIPLYRLFYKYQLGKHELTSEILIELTDLHFTNNENQILSKFLHSYISHRSRMFISQMKGLILIEDYLKCFQVKTRASQYLKDSFDTRLYELYCTVHLKLTLDLESVKKFARETISLNISPRFVSNAYYYLGAAEIHRDFSKCKTNYLKAADILLQIGREKLADSMIKNNLNFVRICWGKEIDQISLHDVSDIMHYEARWGDKDKTITLAEKIGFDKLTAFQWYYLGLATGSPKHLGKAISKLLSIGDKHYANILVKFLPENICESVKECLISIVDEFELKLGGTIK